LPTAIDVSSVVGLVAIGALTGNILLGLFEAGRHVDRHRRVVIEVLHDGAWQLHLVRR